MTRDLYPDFGLGEIVADLDKKAKALIKTQTFPREGIAIKEDLAYGKEEGQIFDIYYNKTSKNPKTLIGVHGGGLVFGSKDINKAFNLRLVKRGFNLASIDYRLISEVSFIDQVRDLARALSHIKDKGYGLSTDKLFIVADSAGAMLSLVVVAALKDPKISRLFGLDIKNIDIKGLALLYPMTGLKDSGSFSLINKPVLASIRDSQIKSYMADIKKVLENISLPPTLIFTSKEDFIRDQALDLKAYLEKRKASSELIDQASSKPLAHGHAINYPDTEEAREAVEKIVGFFDGL